MSVAELRRRVRDLEAENESLRAAVWSWTRVEALGRLLGTPLPERSTAMDDTATVDPRVIADALQMDTLDLARVLTKWAKDALPSPDFDHGWEPSSLDSFDENVARARRYLEAAHAAMQAWNDDNPPDADET